MKSIYYTFLVAAITITSCKNNEEKVSKADPRTIIPFTQQGATTLQAQTTQQPAPEKHNLFHENNVVGTPSVAAGVNPAHGQPSHRCDIPVGAPLNSPVNGANTTQQTNQVQMQPQVQTVTQSVAAKTVTPKGMNPPHGQPNHRCDIPVGAPLNSKPTATTATTSTVSSGQISEKITVPPAVPALLSPSSANTETPEGMNPPHGQAGHRCDVAVGAPLPKS
ncbi:hypothetical protein [Flavobacterium sp. 5]|uniref:hypothetical protein n=1 Tax=Flavobacterium sp. 5 TaxID=2035199 RepID=UPI000C2C74B6|nr:hypothetical protein [Flavobacterium sp. 5]PKB17200.1 hypothetical protein CLU82_2384 [Flavobacterium sp. 5]